MTDQGTVVFRISDNLRHTDLPVPKRPHELLVPLVQAMAFYVFAETLSRSIGIVPDRPYGLSKVTETL